MLELRQCHLLPHQPKAGVTRFNFIKSRLVAGPPGLPLTLALGMVFVIVPIPAISG
jgi:hypothetical protein